MHKRKYFEKTYLSKLVALAVKTCPIREKRKKRKGGTWEGKVTIEKDFEKLPANFMRNFSS